MRLSKFILENMEAILQEWEDFARKIQPINRLRGIEELRDHAKAMLNTVAADLATSQTECERVAKAEGDQPQLNQDTAAEVHADERLRSGFSIVLLVAEYRALRASVLHLWVKDVALNEQHHIADLIRFNEAIDQALAESVSRYSDSVTAAQDVFLGTLGHDLRSPLHTLGLGAQLLMHTEKNNGDLARLGMRMFRSVLRMKQMLDNLLEFTQDRLGTGVEINVADADLATIAEQVAEEFRTSNPDRVIRTTVHGDCKGRWDSGRISRVYQNLISNALQYGFPGQDIIVSSHATETEAVFSVNNQGTPIPDGQHERIFEVLQRAVDTNESGINANMGLGLYIVKEIVTAHHGAVSVVSTEKEGTTFTVSLPRTENE